MSAVLALLLLAPLQDAGGRVKAGVLFSQDHARPGDKLWAAVELEIEEGWHIYASTPQKDSTPTVLDVQVEGGAKIAGEVVWPMPYVEAEGAFQGMSIYEGEVYVGVPLEAAKSATGEIKITVKLTYQACNASVCEDVKAIAASGTLKIGAGEPKLVRPSVFKEFSKKKPAPTPSGNAATQQAERIYTERGLLGILLLAATGGLLSLIMPCVYPLIPITLNYFISQGAGSRAKGLMLSGVYAAGIVISFTGLGFGLALAIGPQGAQVFAANAWVNLAIAAMFLTFAVSFFGAFEFALPASLTNKLAGGGPRSGLGGAFLLGILFSIVTFTCTIPIAATVLGLAASGSHRWTGLMAMLAYSATMALPFFALGAFPSMLKSVPKSGGWLHTVKITVAFLELALALQYVANADIVFKWGVLTRKVMVSVWIVAWVLMASYLLGVVDLIRSRRVPFSLSRLLVSSGFLALAGYFATGLDGRPLGLADIVLPPATKHAREADFATLPPALEAARQRKKPVFLEFTGIT